MLKEYIKEFFDYKLFLAIVLLLSIGLISIYSATYTAGLKESLTNIPHLKDTIEKQLLWAIFGIIILVLTMIVPTKYLELLSFPLYGLSLLVLLVVPFLGQNVSGSTSWFNLGPFKIQPSEFAKISTVLCLANFLTRKDVKIHELKYLLLAFLIVLIPFGLIMLQPDFGTATVYLFMFLIMVFWAGAKLFYIYAVVAIFIAMISSIFSLYFLVAILLVSIIVLYLIKENWSIIFTFCGFLLAVGYSFDYFYDHLAPYQQKRIATFLNPSMDPLGAGYNAIQAKVAIGSGGILGKGFLQGTQTQLKFIPKQWTDFIFCVPGEEFGFIGSMIVVVLLFYVLFRGMKIASSVKSPFPSIASIGIVSVLFYHVIINLGMTLGLLPVMGLPLPFLSYGGSLLISVMVMSGLLLNFYSRRKHY
jgi:rod shape determining protein RodA